MLTWKFAAILTPPLKWPIWTLTSLQDSTKPSMLRFSPAPTQNVYGRPTLNNKTVTSWQHSWLQCTHTIISTIQSECSQQQTFGQTSSAPLAILSELPIPLFGMLTTTFTVKWIQVKILTTLYPSEDGLLHQSSRLKETQLLQVCAAMLGMSTWTEFGCPITFDLHSTSLLTWIFQGIFLTERIITFFRIRIFKKYLLKSKYNH